jgi:hypothetical protein
MPGDREPMLAETWGPSVRRPTGSTASGRFHGTGDVAGGATMRSRTAGFAAARPVANTSRNICVPEQNQREARTTRPSIDPCHVPLDVDRVSRGLVQSAICAKESDIMKIGSWIVIGVALVTGAVSSTLAGTQLQGGSTNGSQLQGSNLQGEEMNGSNLQGGDMNGSQVQGVITNGSSLQGPSGNGSNLQGGDMNGSNIQGLSPNGEQLQGIMPNGIQIQGASQNGMQMQGASPNGQQSQGILLNDRQMQGQRSRGASQPRAEAGSTGVRIPAAHVVGGRLFTGDAPARARGR